MKGLTPWQPWASLVAVGAKWIETRSWPANYRGPLPIHAAASASEGRRDAIESRLARRIVAAGLRPDGIGMPRGKVLAVAILADCRRSPGESIWADDQVDMGDLSAGRFAWIPRDVLRLDRPVPWRGSQGLWDARDFLESCPELADADGGPMAPARRGAVQLALFGPEGGGR